MHTQSDKKANDNSNGTNDNMKREDTQGGNPPLTQRLQFIWKEGILFSDQRT